ncbi:MAG: hypothetical protein JST25_01335 [Actinobacteria bacterium]|nr:hypothetical protein [Actinomycetota bacterium]
MAVFSIGIMEPRSAEAPEPMAYVRADAPDARITGVDSAGNDFFFVAVLDAISDLIFSEREPTPFSLAVAVAGRGGTVHQVMEDGTLRGWRRDFPEPSDDFLSLL